ncbi:hypothetical protein DFH07DRAFT_1056339, partial [Mycena maculata]
MDISSLVHAHSVPDRPVPTACTSPIRQIHSRSSDAMEATGTIEVSTETDVLEEWTQFTHIHGGIYYSHNKYPLVTKENVCDEATRKQVSRAYEKFGDWLDDNAIATNAADDDDAEMVVFIARGTTFVQFASWSRGMIYGFRDGSTAGIVSKGRASFWDHAWSFPMHRTDLPRFMEKEFLTALAFGSNQRVMDIKKTTFPFDDPQIKRLMRVYWDLRGKERRTIPSDLVPALCYHIGSVMNRIEASREWYKHGTPGARMYRDVAIPKSTWNVRVWDSILGIILCGTHKNYRTRLQSTAPHGIISLLDFRHLMCNFMSEWEDSNLVATVLLSVNVGFLAVPNLKGLERSSALVSSLCAMTSIITGLHHVWQHREKKDTEFGDAREYLYYVKLRCRRRPKDRELSAMDLTPTACLLAIPLATLQWSTLSFTVAIAAYAFQSTSGTDGHSLLIALISLLGALTFVVFFYFWRIWLQPVHQEEEDGLDPNVAVPLTPSFWEILHEGITVCAQNCIRKSPLREILRMDIIKRQGESV